MPDQAITTVDSEVLKLTAGLELNLATQGKLPSIATSSASALREIEEKLEAGLLSIANNLSSKESAVISQGRGRFEIVDSEEAKLVRAERLSEPGYKSTGRHTLPAEFADEIVVFSTLSSAPLGRNICDELNVTKGNLQLQQFKDGEISLAVGQNVRDREVFLVAGTSSPVHEQLLELFIAVDAFKRASAKRVTLIMPYCGYARQDKKLKGREPISAKLVAKLLESAGVDRVLTLDLHSDQSIGFFNIPIDNLRASSVLIPALRQKLKDKNVVVVSPDKGGVQRAAAYAKELGVSLAMIYKERTEANKVDRMIVLGDVKGKTCVLVDDMIDTAGTLIKAGAELKRAGAGMIVACCSHAVLSGDAVERLRASDISELICTDSIPLRRAKGASIQVVPTAALFAEAMRRMVLRQSLSELSKDFMDQSLV